MTCRINLYWTKSIKKIGLGTCIGPKRGESNVEAYVCSNLRRVDICWHSKRRSNKRLSHRTSISDLGSS